MTPDEKVKPKSCPKCGGVMEMWGAPRRWVCTVCKHEMPGPKVELERLEKTVKPKLVERAGCDYQVADRVCGLKKADILTCGLCDYYNPRWVWKGADE